MTNNITANNVTTNDTVTDNDNNDVLFTTWNCQGFLNFVGGKLSGVGVVPKMHALDEGHYSFWRTFITDFASMGIVEGFNIYGCYNVFGYSDSESFLITRLPQTRNPLPKTPAFYGKNDLSLTPSDEFSASLVVDETFNGHTFVSFHPHDVKLLNREGKQFPYDNIMVEAQKNIKSVKSFEGNTGRKVEKVENDWDGTGDISVKILPLQSLDVKLSTHYALLNEEIVKEVTAFGNVQYGT